MTRICSALPDDRAEVAALLRGVHEDEDDEENEEKRREDEDEDDEGGRLFGMNVLILSARKALRPVRTSEVR